MTLRCKARVAAASVVAMAAVLAVPAVHWRLVGWARGEPFFGGRPASWWRDLVVRGHFNVCWLYGVGDPLVVVSPPPGFADRLSDSFGNLSPTRRTKSALRFRFFVGKRNSFSRVPGLPPSMKRPSASWTRN